MRWWWKQQNDRHTIARMGAHRMKFWFETWLWYSSIEHRRTRVSRWVQLNRGGSKFELSAFALGVVVLNTRDISKCGFFGWDFFDSLMTEYCSIILKWQYLWSLRWDVAYIIDYDKLAAKKFCGYIKSNTINSATENSCHSKSNAKKALNLCRLDNFTSLRCRKTAAAATVR